MPASYEERWKELENKLKAMSWERFEQLVFEIAQTLDERTQRLQAGDGGADTLVPKQGEQAAEVWQAKHYTKGINWDECEKSLVRALDVWSPSRVIFVFPVDLTSVTRKSFEARLVERPEAVARGVLVEAWTASRLIKELEAHPGLIRRFFGGDAEIPLEKLDRAVRAGGSLESPSDFLDRTRAALTEYLDQDPDYTSNVDINKKSVPPQWGEGHSARCTITIGDQRVEITSRPSEGAPKHQTIAWFSPDAEGQAARQAAVESLARGEGATVTQGLSILPAAPESLNEVGSKYAKEAVSGRVVIGPSPAIDVEFETCRAGVVTWRATVAMRNAPPPPGAESLFVGYADDTLLEIIFEPARFRVRFGMKARMDKNGLLSAGAQLIADAIDSCDSLSASNDKLFKVEKFFFKS